MTKLQNIKTILQNQRNKDYIKRLWLSIRALWSQSCFVKQSAETAEGGFLSAPFSEPHQAVPLDHVGKHD